MTATQSAKQPAGKTVASGKPMLAFRPLPVPQVDVRGFWGDRVDAVASRTADILYERCVAARMLEQIDPDRPSPGVVIPFHSPSPDEVSL
ncbi:hypothetical protein MEA186_29822, partial [Mesorhizobium amorphae CCNWGS0123]